MEETLGGFQEVELIKGDGTVDFVLSKLKNMVLDLLSMLKGFTYGFVMVGLFIILLGGLLYGALYLKIDVGRDHRSSIKKRLFVNHHPGLPA